MFSRGQRGISIQSSRQSWVNYLTKQKKSCFQILKEQQSQTVLKLNDNLLEGLDLSFSSGSAPTKDSLNILHASQGLWEV